MGEGIMKPMNIKSCFKACAICKYWHNTCAYAVFLKNPIANVRNYDFNEESMCVLYGIKKNGSMRCHKYESKFSN